MTTTPEETTKVGIYIGRRMTSKKRLAYFWMFDGSDDAGGYAKQLAPARVGEAWQFTFTADGKMYVASDKRPQKVPLPKRIPRRKLDEYIAQDQIAEQQSLEQSAHKKFAARRSEFEIMCEPLKHLLHATPRHDQRAALINRIIAELYSPPKRPRRMDE